MLEGCVSWPDDLASLYRRKGYWLDVSIPELFANLAAKDPSRLAIIDGERRISLAQVWSESERLAAHLIRWDFGRANASFSSCRTRWSS